MIINLEELKEYHIFTNLFIGDKTEINKLGDFKNYSTKWHRDTPVQVLSKI